MMFVVLIPLVSAIIFYVNKKKLSFLLENTRNIYTKGVKFPISLNIENKSFFPFSNVKIEIEFYNSIIREKSYLTVSTPVLPNNTQTLDFDFSSDHCGILFVSISKITMYDYLHIFTAHFKDKNSLSAKQHQEIIITPNIIDLDLDINTSTSVDYESDVFSKNLKGDDPSEIFDLHEYHDGDKINRIHWKLTAKQGEIIVKDYSLPINTSINLIVGTRKNPKYNLENNLKIFDACLETTACIAYSLCEKEVSFNIFYKTNTSSLVEINTIENFEQFAISIETLLKSGFIDDEISVLSESLKNNESQKKYRNIYITTLVDELELNELALDINAESTTIIHIITSNNDDNNYDKNKFDNIEIIPVIFDELPNALQQINI